MSIEYCRVSGKVCFDKRGAITAANARYREDHIKLRAYPCGDCGKWHLTKTLYWPQAKKRKP